MVVLGLAFSAASAPAFGGPLRREARATAEAASVRPGHVTDLLTRYRAGIGLCTVLETLAGERGGTLFLRGGWSRTDLESVLAAAVRAERAPVNRLARAGTITHARVRFLLVARGELSAMVDDPTLDPVAVAQAIGRDAIHLAEIRRDATAHTHSSFAPADLDAVRRLLERLVASDGARAQEATRALVRAVGDRQLWHPDLSESVAVLAVQENWLAAIASERAGPPFPDERRLPSIYSETDFWVSRGLAAEPGSRFRAKAVEVGAYRCAQTTKPRSYDCAELQVSSRSRRIYEYETGFLRSHAWTTCPVDPVPDASLPVGREVHGAARCIDLALRSSEAWSHPGLVHDRKAEEVRVGDEVCDTHRRVQVVEDDRVVLTPSPSDPNNCWKNVYERVPEPPIHWSRCEGVEATTTRPAATRTPRCADLVLEAFLPATSGDMATLLDLEHTRYSVRAGDLLCDGWRVAKVEVGRVLLETNGDGDNCFVGGEPKP